MKKILTTVFMLVFFLNTSICFSANQWRLGTGENTPLGTEAGADIDTVIYQRITDSLDRMLSKYREGCKIKYLSASTLTVGSGEVMLSDSTGAIRLMQQNTSDTSVSWSDIDTGTEANSTTYYIYAFQETVTTATFSITISTSSTAPSDKTYYRRLGSFYNNADSDIEKIVNDNDGINQTYQAIGVTSSPSTTSTSYVDLTDMSITITTGANPVLVIFSSVVQQTGTGDTSSVILDIDGTDESNTERTFDSLGANVRFPVAISCLKNMTAGAHTFKIQWKTNGTVTANQIERNMQVIEYR